MGIFKNLTNLTELDQLDLRVSRFLISSPVELPVVVAAVRRPLI